MPIPFATTTITIMGRRPQSAVDPSAEGYDDPEPPMPTLATGVRACISTPSETRHRDGASEVDDFALMCDPVDVGLNQYDRVIDEKTGDAYDVYSASRSVAVVFGLAHITGVLRKSRGLTDESLTVAR